MSGEPVGDTRMRNLRMSRKATAHLLHENKSKIFKNGNCGFSTSGSASQNIPSSSSYTSSPKPGQCPSHLQLSFIIWHNNGTCSHPIQKNCLRNWIENILRADKILRSTEKRKKETREREFNEEPWCPRWGGCAACRSWTGRAGPGPVTRRPRALEMGWERTENTAARRERTNEWIEKTNWMMNNLFGFGDFREISQKLAINSA